MATSPLPNPRIFISHSHKDNNFCLRLVRDLRQALGDESSVWYDASGGLSGGEEWWRKVIVELSNRDIFIVILSPDAMASSWVNDEIDLAWKLKNSPRGKFIIPVLYRPCAVREDVDTRQIISFLPPRPYETAFNELLDSIQSFTTSPRKNSRQLIPSIPTTPGSRRFRWYLVAIGALLALTIVVGGLLRAMLPQPVQKTSVTGTGTQQGAQPCPTARRDLLYWGHIVPLPISSAGDRVESVTCAYLTGSSSLQALVTRRTGSSAAPLSFYIYDNISSSQPALLFSLDNLTDGSAEVSKVNTIITSEVDPGSSINASQPNSNLKVDLFREFEWVHSENTFIQVSFPGMFPDLTRFQAEDDQAGVNKGQDSWKRDAIMTARHMASSLLQWDANAPATLVSGGGSQDLNAVVSLKHIYASNTPIKVTLSRLEGDTNDGIWEVTAVNSDQINMNFMQSLASIHTPLQIIGGCRTYQGTFCTVEILDHLYNNIGAMDAIGTSTPTNTFYGYNISVPYKYTFPGEEGIVMLYARNADNSIATATMLKVLVD